MLLKFSLTVVMILLFVAGYLIIRKITRMAELENMKGSQETMERNLVFTIDEVMTICGEKGVLGEKKYLDKSITNAVRRHILFDVEGNSLDDFDLVNLAVSSLLNISARTDDITLSDYLDEISNGMIYHTDCALNNDATETYVIPKNFTVVPYDN